MQTLLNQHWHHLPIETVIELLGSDAQLQAAELEKWMRRRRAPKPKGGLA